MCAYVHVVHRCIYVCNVCWLYVQVYVKLCNFVCLCKHGEVEVRSVHTFILLACLKKKWVVIDCTFVCQCNLFLQVCNLEAHSFPHNVLLYIFYTHFLFAFSAEQVSGSLELF